MNVRHEMIGEISPDKARRTCLTFTPEIVFTAVAGFYMKKDKLCYWRWREKKKLHSKGIPEVICYNNTCDGYNTKCKEYKTVVTSHKVK